MNWIQCLSNAIYYIEENLTDNIDISEVSRQSYASNSHFQFVFHVVIGMTVGEYIRNRRLSLAAQDLLQPNTKIIDVAMRYQYDTQESFSKAFTRFQGIPPSRVQRGNIKIFHPLTISITIQGGFDMSRKLIDDFLLLDLDNIKGKEKQQAYQNLVNWAGQARSRNPGVFDALTEWILDDTKWTDAYLVENEWIFMQGVLARFKEQNRKLREFLKELEPSGVVNAAVFKALDEFDAGLSGQLCDEKLRETIAKVFADFSVMKERSIREIIAGSKTGPTGTDSVDFFGYVNFLKDCDARVQWTLFMPDVVKKQQDGFAVDSFEYRTMPAVRFVGLECSDEHNDMNMERRKKTMQVLDTMPEYKCGFDYDILFMHHYGRGVDVEPWHGFWGRFVKADTPVPEGFVHWDLVPDDNNAPYLTFRSQFAFATFSGDIDAMHKRDGYDSDAMYDVTRNIILGQGITIPYPEIYWTAEVFLDGCDNPSTAYMFSVLLD